MDNVPFEEKKFYKPTRIMSGEVYKEKMLKLRGLEGNNTCADCQKDQAVDFISLSLGVFICIDCSGKHRHLGTKYSTVRSIFLDTMDEQKLQQMEKMGNKKAAEKWEKQVPPCWPRPIPDDHETVVEQWIRSKYERQEFVEEAGPEMRPYTNGAKYGWLFKREKSKGNWNQRFFVLSAKQGQLSYYLRREDNEPKQSVQIRQLNCMLIGEEWTQRKHSMLITFPFNKNGFFKTRHILVYSDHGFEIVDWYITIRAARLKYLEPYLYGINTTIMSRLLSREYIKMGNLHKTGPKSGQGWKKRFVCVDTHRFLYFENSMSPEPTGEVSIDPLIEPTRVCSVVKGCHGNHPTPPYIYTFHVTTQQKDRPIFNFCTESVEEMEEWIAAFTLAIQKLKWVDHVHDNSYKTRALKRSRMALLSNMFSRSMVME